MNVAGHAIARFRDRRHREGRHDLSVRLAQRAPGGLRVARARRQISSASVSPAISQSTPGATQRSSSAATGVRTVLMEASPGYLGEAATVAPRMRALAATASSCSSSCATRSTGCYSSYHFHRGKLNLPPELTFDDYVAALPRIRPRSQAPGHSGSTSGTSRCCASAAMPSSSRSSGRTSPQTASRSCSSSLCARTSARFMQRAERFPRQSIAASGRLRVPDEQRDVFGAQQDLHRLAMRTNAVAEPLMRRYPVVKQSLRPRVQGAEPGTRGLRPDAASHAGLADRLLRAIAAPARAAAGATVAGGVAPMQRRAGWPHDAGIRTIVAVTTASAWRFWWAPGRSGTTLLYKLLCLHPQVAYISNYENRLGWFPDGHRRARRRRRLDAKLHAWFNRGRQRVFHRPALAQEAVPDAERGRVGLPGLRCAAFPRPVNCPTTRPHDACAGASSACARGRVRQCSCRSAPRTTAASQYLSAIFPDAPLRAPGARWT